MRVRDVTAAYGDFRIPYRGINVAPIPKSLIFHQDPPSSFLRDNFLTMRLEMRVRGRASEQWKVIVDETATTVCNGNLLVSHSFQESNSGRCSGRSDTCGS